MDTGHGDLDETRRLLYIALLRNKTEKHVLVGTLTNALAHHQDVGDPDFIAAALLSVTERDAPEGITWVKLQIDRITAELEERTQTEEVAAELEGGNL